MTPQTPSIEALQALVENQRQTIAALQQTIAGYAQKEKLSPPAPVDDAATLRQTLNVVEDEHLYNVSLALTLANAAYDALIVMDDERRVIAINNSAETLFNYKRPIGESIVTVANSPEIEVMIDDALINKEESFEEQIVLNKHTYRVRTQVIQRDGNFFVALALQDISELVRLNRARRDMVANISHELRTPIANIRLIIDSLFHEQDKPKRKQSTSALKAIARETDSLLWLVQELLDLSMIESGQAILRMVAVPSELLVEEAIDRMIDQSETKELKITSKVPKDIHVLCDRDQARRVLLNLIHNAIKWSPIGQTIHVEVESDNDEVTFTVLDKGPGVQEEFRERIFERFYQVDPSRSGGDGTGLGLAICKHIVEAHGGRIWAESNAGGAGGIFRFTLPTADDVAYDDEYA